MQTSDWVRILQRFIWYAGVGLLVASVAALAIRFWTPEPLHVPLFLLMHSLSVGVVLMLLIPSLSEAKTRSLLDITFLGRTSVAPKEPTAEQPVGGRLRLRSCAGHEENLVVAP